MSLAITNDLNQLRCDDHRVVTAIRGKADKCCLSGSLRSDENLTVVDEELEKLRQESSSMTSGPGRCIAQDRDALSAI
jgi:hypothetical protein